MSKHHIALKNSNILNISHVITPMSGGYNQHAPIVEPKPDQYYLYVH